jgi:hypothetical protein
MNRQLTVLLCTVVVGFASLPSQSWAQAKTAKACTEEWRADKAGFQAKGITEKAYVTECRAGGAATPTAAPAPAPAAPKPTVAAPAPAPVGAGQGKTAKVCTEEWRADKAAFQAKGITEKAYVAECRGGAAAVPTAAPAPAPAAPAPKPTAAAPAPAPATAERPVQAPVARAPSSGTPSGAGQFATEAQAKANCPIDTIVWVNLRSKIYHFSGTHNYGNTKDGAYMCERDTAAQGMRAAKNEQHP